MGPSTIAQDVLGFCAAMDGIFAQKESTGGAEVGNWQEAIFVADQSAKKAAPRRKAAFAKVRYFAEA
jgi:hypothetical protein